MKGDLLAWFIQYGLDGSAADLCISELISQSLSRVLWFLKPDRKAEKFLGSLVLTPHGCHRRMAAVMRDSVAQTEVKPISASDPFISVPFFGSCSFLCGCLFPFYFALPEKSLTDTA